MSDRGMAALERVRTALQAAHGLVLLRGALRDEASGAVMALLRLLADATSDPDVVASAYARAFGALADVADEDALPGLADAWQAHLTARIVDDANPWSRQAECADLERVAPGLRRQAARDLGALRLLYALDATTVACLASSAVAPAGMPGLDGAWVPWHDLSVPSAPDAIATARDAMRLRLANSDDWTELVEPLGGHWARHGAGPLARYTALRWEGGARGLHPIAYPDPIRLSDLVAYEREQRALVANVERFLAGLPAHDTLLYGPPGTGKSSTVKAIANSYADRGLRLIEVRKEDLDDLPAIVALVRGRAPRFLLFVDDLSFEETETQYKRLKALLEGAAEARPANLLIMATTNRRNLVRESFDDRGAPGGDVHEQDTLREKISLAARFGLRVTFAAPDQERYLTIAQALARGRGLCLAGDDLRARALLWDRQHPGRSGRTARQFVDELEAELRLAGTCGDALHHGP